MHEVLTFIRKQQQWWATHTQVSQAQPYGMVQN
jgi:hypothetical protein